MREVEPSHERHVQGERDRRRPEWRRYATCGMACERPAVIRGPDFCLGESMPDYDFQSLASQDFEALVRDLLQEELGVHIESFGPGKDGGVDLRFAVASDTTIIQAKRYGETSRYSFAPSIIADADNIRKLSPTRYIVATSLNLTPSAKDKLVEDLPGIPIVSGDIFSRSDLNNLLGKYPKVEQRHFKLWLHSTAMLSRIVASATYERSIGEVEQIKARVRVFVDTPAVDEAQNILSENGCLIISGAPGVGKTTLARLLVLLHLAQDWQLVVMDEVEDALAVFDDTRNQIFVFDDFLGRTRLTPDYLNKVDQPLVRFMEKVRRSKRTRFVMTTREYILAQAQIVSDRMDHPDVDITKIVLDVDSYTRVAKAQILFNHIFFSDLSVERKKTFVQNKLYKKIVDHQNYNPRLIETITNKNFVDSLDGDDYAKTIMETLDRPFLIWEKAYNNHLSGPAQALLAAVFFGDGARSLKDVQEKFDSLYDWTVRDGSVPDARKFENALREVDGSFVSFARFDVFNDIWEMIDFANPSVSDFLEAEYSKTTAALHVVNRFVYVHQLKSAWEFLQRHPAAMPSISVLGPMLASACARVCAAPVAIVDNAGKHRFNDIGHLERIALVLSMREVVAPPVIESAALELARRYRDERAGTAREALRFLNGLATTTAGLSELKVSIAEIVDEAVLSHVKSRSELTVEEIGGVIDYFGDDEIRDDVVYALNDIVKDISVEMENISTPDELEEFRSLVLPLLHNYDIEDHVVRDAIEAKEYQLNTEHEHDDYDDYRPNEVFHSYDPDRDIDSLFTTLIAGS